MSETTFKTLMTVAVAAVVAVVILGAIETVNSFNTVRTVVHEKPTYVTRAAMTTAACRAIRRGESERYIQARYGGSPSSSSGNPKNPAIGVDYPYDTGFYNTMQGTECDIYYDKHGGALMVYLETLPNA